MNKLFILTCWVLCVGTTWYSPKRMTLISSSSNVKAFDIVKFCMELVHRQLMHAMYKTWLEFLAIGNSCSLFWNCQLVRSWRLSYQHILEACNWSHGFWDFFKLVYVMYILERPSNLKFMISSGSSMHPIMSISWLNTNIYGIDEHIVRPTIFELVGTFATNDSSPSPCTFVTMKPCSFVLKDLEQFTLR